MGIRRSAITTPDLFKAPLPATQVASSAVIVTEDSEPRYLLPKDLAGALTRLNDRDIDTLLTAVTSEAARRGMTSRSGKGPVVDAKRGSRRPPVTDMTGRLTKGQLNAVRAAFKAGVKPSAIARQFGLAQSDVRQALAQRLDRDA